MAQVKRQRSLDNLFPKALLISKEIICLLKGGYPDGALARWRSLHEVSITAMYISKHGESVALPYLASFHFAARRAMHDLIVHAEKSGITPLSDEDMVEFDLQCEKWEKILGFAIEKDKNGEWPKINKVHKDFASIERDVGMDYCRPRYKWASVYTHAGHRPHTNLLGTTDTQDSVLLIGQSNGGYVDPLQMTAITLVEATITYLSYEPNVDKAIHIKVMQRLLHEMLELPQAGESSRDDSMSQT